MSLMLQDLFYKTVSRYLYLHPSKSYKQTMKTAEIDFLIEKAIQQSKQAPEIQQKTHHNSHLFRAIFIAIDFTQSMNIKDLKPSRLGVTLKQINRFIRKAKDQTPICKFMVARVENELCKPQCQFTYSENQLQEMLNSMRISNNSGFFSLENTLSVAMDYFQNIPNYFHKQLLIVQSSAFTKDYRDIYETIKTFQKTQISVNIASLVGWTFVYTKLVQYCHGRYVTISSQQELQKFMNELAKPPNYDQSKVKKRFVRLSLAKRQYSDQKIRCFCHFKPVDSSFFICGICKAVLCGSMPMQCAVCGIFLVFPSDLYRHQGA